MSRHITTLMTGLKSNATHCRHLQNLYTSRLHVLTSLPASRLHVLTSRPTSRPHVMTSRPTSQPQVMTSQLHVMTSHSNKELFEGKSHAESYALYRPTYPPGVYTTITDYCQRSEHFEFGFAVDLACGTGQSTEPLCEYFVKVFGIDVSVSQVEQAEKQRKAGGKMAEYKVGCAENLSDITPGTVDLVTCAQSFHWFDHDKVFKEAHRVLKPSGVLAVYGYGKVELSLESANQVVEKFFSETLGKYWPPEREIVNRRFRGIELPFEDFSRVDDLEIVRQMPLSSFVGYLSSWSPYRTLLKAYPHSPVLEQVQQDLMEAYRKSRGKTHDGKEPWLDVSWPVYILLGRNTKFLLKT